MRRADLAILCLALAAPLAAPVARAQDTTMVHAKHMAWERTAFLLVDELEMRSPLARQELSLELVGWVGGATRRIWFKAENDDRYHPELQVLYGRLIAPYWDLQMGARVDTRFDLLNPHSVTAVLGIQGLAPGWFDIESALLLDIDARLTAQFTASHDLYLTQRLILQPRVETSWAAQPDRQQGIGAGVGPTEYALRLRYELRREFAPYVGLVREARYAETARLWPFPERSELALGLRLWF